MSFVVAIDGPAGTGKGTITKIIAKKLNLINIDTGAMYRSVTFACIKKNIAPNEEDKIRDILENINIELKNINGEQKVFLNGEDVSNEIRTPEVDNIVAVFSALKIVRDKVTPIQRKMGEQNDVIMEGRDIGTVVFPDADVKIFLDCSIEERARRRYEQNLEKGIKESYEEVLSSIKIRHKLEVEREIAPFVKADDAITVDTSNMTIEEVAEEVEKIILDKKALKI